MICACPTPTTQKNVLHVRRVRGPNPARLTRGWGNADQAGRLEVLKRKGQLSKRREGHAAVERKQKGHGDEGKGGVLQQAVWARGCRGNNGGAQRVQPPNGRGPWT